MKETSYAACRTKTYGGGGGDGNLLRRAENDLGLSLTTRPFAGDDANWIDRRRFGRSFLTESENPRDLDGKWFPADTEAGDDDEGGRMPFLFGSETPGAAKVTEALG